MGRTLALLGLLLGLTWIACAVETPKAPAATEPPLASRWRRTADGWEKIREMKPPSPSYDPGIHPAVIAGLLLLASLSLLASLPAQPYQTAQNHTLQRAEPPSTGKPRNLAHDDNPSYIVGLS